MSTKDGINVLLNNIDFAHNRWDLENKKKMETNLNYFSADFSEKKIHKLHFSSYKSLLLIVVNFCGKFANGNSVASEPECYSLEIKFYQQLPLSNRGNNRRNEKKTKIHRYTERATS